jgi:hypothetical protein
MSEWTPKPGDVVWIECRIVTNPNGTLASESRGHFWQTLPEKVLLPERIAALEALEVAVEACAVALAAWDEASGRMAHHEVMNPLGQACDIADTALHAALAASLATRPEEPTP